MLANVFVIEGPDGVGKTTLIDRLVDYFNKSTSFKAMKLSPTRTGIGNDIRNIVAYQELDDTTESLLMCSTLSNLYHTHLKPHLEDKRKIIFIDRWTLSHYVYQGYLKNKNFHELADNVVDLEAVFQPTGYILLDAPDELLDARLNERNITDKFEVSETSKKVREGYRELALRKFCDVVYVDKSLEENTKTLLSHILRKLQ